MKFPMLPLAAAIVLWIAAGTAGAADVRTYTAVSLGAVVNTDSTLSGPNSSGTLSTSPGYAATGALGLDFGMARVEAEVGWRSTDINTLSSKGNNTRIDGTTQLISYMLNGHLTVPGHAPVKPFITGGVGIAVAYWSALTFPNTNIVIPGSRDTEIAYQAGVGASYDVTENVSIDGTYRYLGTTDFDIEGVKAGYASHNMMIDIRYRF